MPNCFRLVSKETGQAEPFCDIDDKICAHFNVTPDPDLYYWSWYDSIGLLIAIGRTFDEIIADTQLTERTREIAAFLKEHYTSDAWYSPRRF